MTTKNDPSRHLANCFTALLGAVLAGTMSMAYYVQYPWTSGIWFGLVIALATMALMQFGEYHRLNRKLKKRRKRKWTN